MKFHVQKPRKQLQKVMSFHNGRTLFMKLNEKSLITLDLLTPQGLQALYILQFSCPSRLIGVRFNTSCTQSNAAAATAPYETCRRRGLDVCREDDAAYLSQLGSTSAILLCVAKVNQDLGPYQRSPRRSRPIRCVSDCVRGKILQKPPSGPNCRQVSTSCSIHL